jgi:hypothetical protein
MRGSTDSSFLDRVASRLFGATQADAALSAVRVPRLRLLLDLTALNATPT